MLLDRLLDLLEEKQLVLPEDRVYTQNLLMDALKQDAPPEGELLGEDIPDCLAELSEWAAKNGVIILCHDIYSTTAAAAEKAIPELVNKGFQLVTVSELLSFHKDGPKPGTVYARVDPENKITGE